MVADICIFLIVRHYRDPLLQTLAQLIETRGQLLDVLESRPMSVVRIGCWGLVKDCNPLRTRDKC